VTLATRAATADVHRGSYPATWTAQGLQREALSLEGVGTVSASYAVSPAMQIAPPFLMRHATDPLALDGEAASSLALAGCRLGQPRGSLADPDDVLGDLPASLDS